MTKFYNLTKMLAAMMFRKDSPIIKDGAIAPDSEPGLILARVRQLTDERKINTAENLLFDSLDKQKPVYAAIALDFYARLSELPESELEAADFSVDEIGQGISDMMKFYNIKIVAKKDSNAPNIKTPPPGVLVRKPIIPGQPIEKPAAPNVLADKPRK